MGLFSRFCVWALRCTAEEYLHRVREAISSASSPDERGDIRDNPSTAPDIAVFIRATLALLACAARFDCPLLPQSKSALERIGVGAEADLARQLVDLVGVAAAQHDVIRLQCGKQALQDVIDRALPFLPANALEGCVADALLERLAAAVRQVSELHRLQNAIHDHRGAKT